MATSQGVTLAVVNVLAWPVIHVGFAWAGTRARAERFRPDAWLFRTRAFERTGRIYEVLFGVKAWKGRLPDGAAWFKSGFKKRSLARADRAYLDRFVVEACRGDRASRGGEGEELAARHHAVERVRVGHDERLRQLAEQERPNEGRGLAREGEEAEELVVTTGVGVVVIDAKA